MSVLYSNLIILCFHVHFSSCIWQVQGSTVVLENTIANINIGFSHILGLIHLVGCCAEWNAVLHYYFSCVVVCLFFVFFKIIIIPPYLSGHNVFFKLSSSPTWNVFLSIWKQILIEIESADKYWVQKYRAFLHTQYSVYEILI